MANTKVIFNPFDCKFSTYKEENPEVNNILTDERICLSSAQVGDLVMESSTIVNRVDVVTNNLDVRPVFGIIIQKTSSTECIVLLFGVVGGFSGLVKGNKIFLSNSGGLTSTPPTTGYLQSLGVAKEESVIDFIPNMQRVRRT